MNEICKNCGREKSSHDSNDCPGMFKMFFKPSGRVSVPVEFIEAVRGIVNPKKCVCEPYTKCCYHVETYEKLRAMLDQMEGGGK
jgi:hypothetical protein